MGFCPASKEDFQTLLGLFTALSLSMNHVYTTETLGKELRKDQRTLCKGFTNKNFKYISFHWEKCQAKSGKLMFMDNHRVVDWGPHGIWLSNCSDDINSTVCDYVTQVAWQVTNTAMEHYHDRGLLRWLDGGMGPPRPRIVLDKQMGPKQWESGNLLRTLKNLGLGLDISQGPIVVIETISFVIINHISYKLVFHFLLL